MSTSHPFRITVTLLLASALSLLAACNRNSNEATGPLSVDELVVALKPDKDPESMLAERDALTDYLSEKLGVSVRVIIPLSAAVINEGLANGTVDIAYLSSTNTAQLMARGVASLMLVGEIDGNSYYESLWLSLKEKPYESVTDLRGKKIAFSSKSSTSGFIIPLWSMRQQELLADGEQPEAFFGDGNVFYGTGYVSAAEQVLRGEAEAAAVSDYVFYGDKHLSEADRAKLKVIAVQGPVPTHVIAVRSSLPAEDLHSIRRALLDLNEVNPALRDKVFTSKLIERDADEHLKNIRDALAYVEGLIGQ